MIVPVYNAEAYLQRCVASVLAQDEPRFELILVDDGSTDGSGALCDKYAAGDPRVRVTHRENGGQSAARNTGLETAAGEYLCFLDADDYLEQDCLSYLLSLFPEKEGCLVTACNHLIDRGSRGTPASSRESCLLTRKEAVGEVLFHGCVDVAPWAKLFRRRVFDRIRFPEGRIFEDTWIMGEILAETEFFSFGSRCCYHYVIHEGSTVRKGFEPRGFQYIEAAEKLARDALRIDPECRTGAVRRINHARLSVLRNMKRCGREYEPKRDALRREILQDAPVYLQDPRTPKRDRLAVLFLRPGLWFFYLAWDLYSLARG